MLDLPKGTVFDRRIPKQKLYNNLSVTTELKRVFIDQISTINWRNKIAASTVNVAVGETVEEIEVIEIHLRQPSLDERVLQLIDREIPYHILFLLVHEDKAQFWIGYKEQSRGGTRAFKPGTYYHTEWMPQKDLELRLTGLNMDAVYEGFIRQIAGERLSDNAGGDLGEAIARDERRQKLLREIAVLEKKALSEKQPRRKWELVEEIKKIKELLNNGD